MQINANFSERAVVRPGDLDWVPSPMAGVERQMLDRIGGEVARATSIVRYAAKSDFSPHEHGGGRGIPGSGRRLLGRAWRLSARNLRPQSHRIAPHALQRGGLHDLRQAASVRPRGSGAEGLPHAQAAFLPGLVSGLSVLPLHSHGTENVALVRWEPGTTFNRHRHWGGEEIFVLEGTFQDEGGAYPTGSWLRSPHLSEHTPYSETGCLIYVKTGHLPVA